MSIGDVVEPVAAFFIALALFLIFTVISGLTIGLGAALIVVGVYLGYVAQFLTQPLRRRPE